MLSAYDVPSQRVTTVAIVLRAKHNNVKESHPAVGFLHPRGLSFSHLFSVFSLFQMARALKLLTVEFLPTQNKRRKSNTAEPGQSTQGTLWMSPSSN